jgi:fibronectin type 3 domain-containing protein
MVTIKVVRGGNASVPVRLTVAPAVTTTSSTTTTVTGTSTTATLTWNPVTSTDLAGYKVYMGTASGVYETSINAGNVTSYMVSNLALGTTYYFVVTDYNTSGSESLPSNEVSKSIY